MGIWGDAWNKVTGSFGSPKPPPGPVGSVNNGTMASIADVPIVGEAVNLLGLTSPTNSEPLDTSILAPGIAQANEAYQAALAQQANANRLDQLGNTLQGAGTIQNQQIGGIPGISAQGLTAYTAGPIERVQAQQVGTAQQVGPIDINTQLLSPSLQPLAKAQAAEIGAIERAQASQIGQAAQTGAVGVGGVTVDPRATALRDETLQSVRAIGEAPSVAEQQYKANLAAASSEALGAAAQARGADRASARRAAVLGIAQSGIGGAAQMAAAAAQEELGKRQAVAQGIAGVQSQDLALASKQAELSQSRNNLQGQLDAAIAQGNTAAINAIKTRQAELDTEINATNVQAENARLAKNAEFTQQSGITNATAQNTRDLARAQMELEAEKSSLGARMDLSKTNAQIAAGNADRSLAQGTTNAQLATTAATANAGAYNTAEQNAALARNAAAQASMEAKLRVDAANQQAELERQRANQANTTTVETQNAANRAKLEADRLAAAQAAQTARMQALQAQQGAAGLNIEANKGILDAQAGLRQAQEARAASEKGSTLGALATGGAALLTYSDKRLKKNIKEIPDDDVLAMAEKLKNFSFNYKPGTIADDGGQEQVGFMAQDLQKSRLGKMFVNKDEDGNLAVDYDKLTPMLALAAIKAQKGARRG